MNDSLRASYRCGRGHAWTTHWDRQAAGWPREKNGVIARAGAVLAVLALFAAILAWIVLLAVTGRMTP